MIHQIPRSNQHKSLADVPWVGLWICGSGRCWCAWVSWSKKLRRENDGKVWKAKSGGETSPWKRRWNTKLGINDKPIMILSFHPFKLLFFWSISSTSPMMGCFGFSHDVMISAVGFPPALGKESLAWRMKLFDGIAYGVWKVISRWTVRSQSLNDVAIQELTSQIMNIMCFSFMCWWWLYMILMRQELIERVLWLMVYHGGNAACNRILYIHGRAW